MAPPTLGRLVGRAAIQSLVDSAARLSPGRTIRVLDGDGSIIASAGPGADEHAAPAIDPRGRPIVVGELVLGSVVVEPGPGGATAGGSTGSGGSTSAAAELTGAAIELAAAAALERRAVTAAAIGDLRELALLTRLSEALGATADAAEIASSVLAAVARPLGPADGLVLAADDRTVVASSADDERSAALARACAPLIGRLRSEDPVIGQCVQVDRLADGRYGGIIAADLRTSRGHHGSIVLARPAGAAPFTSGDRQLLASVAGQAAIAIERAELQQVIANRRVLDQELSIGRRIQLSLMPRRFPELPGWQVASAYEPAREVGGDFYDVFRLRDHPDSVGIVVADVTGKGIPAALLMADARGLIHAAADHMGDPSDTLSRVNRILVSERASGLFVTVAHAVLDVPTGRLSFVSAGHDPVHILRADGRLDALEPAGRLIGLVDDPGLHTVVLELAPGDAFVGHTDGVTEARSTSGGFYGEDRFRDLLSSLRGADASTIVETVVADVSAFRDGAEPSDDLTLVVVRREPSGDGIAASGQAGARQDRIGDPR